jgi:hypothetical protein
MDFPVVQVWDVYQVIGHYLKHSAELDEYLERRARTEGALLTAHEDEWRPSGLRERMIARRTNP